MPLLAAIQPGLHARHELELVLPGMGLVLPGGQSTHEAWLVLPLVGLYVPAEHGVKVMLSLVAPTVAQKPPEAHWLQAEAPGVVRLVVGDLSLCCRQEDPPSESSHVTTTGLEDPLSSLRQ